MKVYLSRWVCQDGGSNLRRFEAECEKAVKAGASIVVFPELFLTGYSRSVDLIEVRKTFSRLSADAPEVLFVYGSISEDRRNRVTVWSAGEQIAFYDKVHLFRPNGEFDYWKPGDRYVAFRWHGLTIGLMNCNDLRFPEQARALTLDARCDMLIAPAWWPWRRDWVWSALLRARAIENGVWVLGCCIAGSVFEGEDFAGAGNHVFDPLGEEIRTADDVLYEVDLENGPKLIVDPRGEAVEITEVEVFRRGERASPTHIRKPTSRESPRHESSSSLIWRSSSTVSRWLGNEGSPNRPSGRRASKGELEKKMSAWHWFLACSNAQNPCFQRFT